MYAFDYFNIIKLHRRAIDAEENNMKKYVYLLFVAFFATMSFTSCNDDDEPSDPSNGKYSCSLTVNGKKFPAKKLGGEYYT